MNNIDDSKIGVKVVTTTSDEENTSENVKTSGNIHKETAEDIDDNVPTKKIKLDTSIVQSNATDTCLVCMEEENEVKHLKQRHGCSQCVQTAWKICEDCDERLLSRSCPVCRSDYAPLLMYAMPGLPLAAVLDSSIDQNEKKRLLALATIMKGLVSKINVAIWKPTEGKMLFSLPNSSDDNNQNNDTDAKVVSCIVCEITLNSEEIKNDTFKFTNEIWEQLINQSEEDGKVCESVCPGHALKFIFEASKSEGSKLFTQFYPDFIDSILLNYA